MTIGPLVPGSPTRVTPDTVVAPYIDIYGPAPDGLVVADDILGAYDAALHVQSLITEGVRQVRTGTDAQMAALTDVQANDTYVCKHYGVYTAVSAANTYGTPWEVTSTGTPGIVWRHSLSYLLSSFVAKGLARLGPSPIWDITATPDNKIPLENIQNRTERTQTMYGSSLIDEAVTFGNTSSPSNALWQCNYINDGDVFMGQIGPLWVNNTATSGIAYVYVDFIEAYEPGGGTTYTIAESRVLINAPGYITIPYRHVCADAGTGSIQIQLRFVASTADNNFVVSATDNATRGGSQYQWGSQTIYRP